MTMRVVPPAALAAGTLAIFMLAAAPQAAAQPTFAVTNLVSNQQGVAQNFDPDLVNAWGIAHAPGAPLWVNDNGTGKSTVYDPNTGAKQSLTVNIPGGAPTGIVFVPQDNGDNDDFQMGKNGVRANSLFIFVTEGGLIEGWNPNVDQNNAVVAVNLHNKDAVFKGTTVSGDLDLLYAADFHNNRVLIFDDHFSKVGSFTDPDLPRRFAPFNVVNIRGLIYVAFAKRERNGDDEVAGPGLGYVDVFYRDGRLKTRLIANGPLNAPWGMTVAPTGFGGLDGSLLVGNFGDGKINAFDINTCGVLATFQGTDNIDLVIDALWGTLAYPNGAVTFAAGPDDEANRLMGKIAVSGGKHHAVAHH